VPSTRAMFQLLEATDAAAGQEATR
jgi:hypothetical protein